MEGQVPRSTRRVVAPPPPRIPLAKIGIAAGLAIAAVVGWVMFADGSSETPAPRTRRPRSTSTKPVAERPAPVAESPREPGVKINVVETPAPAAETARAPEVKINVIETPPPAAPVPVPPAPGPSSEVARQSGTANPAALERVRAAREELARETREEREREARLEKAFREQTERQPLRIKLGEDLFIDQVKVASYSGGLLKLVWPQGAVDYPVDAFPEAARTSLLTGVLGAAAPRDRFEIGKIFLRTGDYDRAASCFSKAAEGVAALKPLCPDVERIRRMSRVFEGAFRVSGNDLGISWSFRRPDEAKDFNPNEESKVAVRPDAGLEISGDKTAFATVKEIPFRDRVKVSVTAREANLVMHLLGIQFLRPDGREVLIYAAMVTKARIFGVFRHEDDRTIELLPPMMYGGGSRMEMEFVRGKFSFRIGQRTLWTGKEAGFTDVEVILGGAAYAKEGEKEGKAVAFFREALTSELARERRVSLGGGKGREGGVARAQRGRGPGGGGAVGPAGLRAGAGPPGEVYEVGGGR
jgi:hypothetical protein